MLVGRPVTFLACIVTCLTMSSQPDLYISWLSPTKNRRYLDTPAAYTHTLKVPTRVGLLGGGVAETRKAPLVEGASFIFG